MSLDGRLSPLENVHGVPNLDGYPSSGLPQSPALPFRSASCWVGIVYLCFHFPSKPWGWVSCFYIISLPPNTEPMTHWRLNKYIWGRARRWVHRTKHKIIFEPKRNLGDVFWAAKDLTGPGPRMHFSTGTERVRTSSGFGPPCLVAPAPREPSSLAWFGLL